MLELDARRFGDMAVAFAQNLSRVDESPASELAVARLRDLAIRDINLEDAQCSVRVDTRQCSFAGDRCDAGGFDGRETGFEDVLHGVTVRRAHVGRDALR